MFWLFYYPFGAIFDAHKETVCEIQNANFKYN